MGIRYYLNPITDQPHIYDHGVSEDEVEWILARPGEDERSSNGTRQAIGTTSGGRYLRVIYVPDPVGDDVFVITAYPLSGPDIELVILNQRIPIEPDTVGDIGFRGYFELHIKEKSRFFVCGSNRKNL